MSDSLKSMTDVIIESKSISSPAPFTSTTAIEVRAVMDLVLSLPRVQSGDHFHMFISLFFMENQNEMHMFVANRHDKTFQLMWLEKQYKKGLIFGEGKGIVLKGLIGMVLK